MTMQRRTFLRAGIGTGAAAVAFPAWSAALARPGAGTVAERIQAGRAAGKPVLVLLVPQSAEDGVRLWLWSELLCVADDATLAELALCEVVCARRDDAAAGAQAGRVIWPKVSRDDVAVLLETNACQAQCISGRGLPEVGGTLPDEARYEAEVRCRAAALAERLHAALLPYEGSLDQRAAAALSCLGEVWMELVLDHYPRPRLAHLDRAAAIVLAEARAQQSAEKETNLARAALQRLWERAPEGTQWSKVGNCSGCGMGHTPVISRQFLRYYAG